MSSTVKYVSLMRCKGGNPTLDEEDGDEAIVPGKKPETWMPRVVAETEDGQRVVGTCYKRQALVELPEWMQPENAFEWVRENEPNGFEDFYDGVKADA